MKILVVSFAIPRPDMFACQRRFKAMLQMMADRHQVTFHPQMDLAQADSSLTTETIARYASGLTDLGIELRSSDPRQFNELVRRERFDVAFFEYWRPAYASAPAFRWHQPDAGVIVDSVDLHFARELGQVEADVLPREVYLRHRWRELATYRNADAVITASQPDKERLRAEGGLPPIEVIPIIMPTRTASGTRDPRRVLFVGGFANGDGHNPNMDGIVWFVNDIWPAVVAAVPDARLTVVGSDPPAEIRALGNLPGIEVAGWVPDTAPYLDQAAVAIAPYRYGAGMKGKVAEALASAVPVVATPIGAQGFDATSGEHLLIAEEENAFARSVVEMLLDPARARAIGMAGQKLAAALTSPAAIAERLEQLLERVAGRPSSPVRSVTRRLDSRLRWMAATLPRAAFEKAATRYEEVSSC